MGITRIDQYSQIKGSSYKYPCKVATTANVDLSAGNCPTSADGINVSAGDRILVWKQSTAANNGVYIVVSAGNWSRDVDMSVSDDVYMGLQVYVNEGNTYGEKAFILYSANPLTLGVSALDFKASPAGVSMTGTTDNGIMTLNGTSPNVTVESNLSFTGTLLQVTGSILPGANTTYDLGSATFRWNIVYTGDLNLKNEYGDWTIVEGEDDLYLYNNKKNKVYTINITEVDGSIAPPKK